MSALVPMLTHSTVTTAQTHLSGGEKQKALDAVASELFSGSSSLFDPNILEERSEVRGKLNFKRPKQPKSAVPKGRGLLHKPQPKKDPDVYAKALTPGFKGGKAKPVELEFYDKAFESLPVLVSKIGHETVHAQQYQKGIGGTSPHVFGQGSSNPSLLGMQEVETHLWELENMTQTGLAASPDKIKEIEDWLEGNWQKVESTDQPKVQARYDKAKRLLTDYWKTHTRP